MLRSMFKKLQSRSKACSLSISPRSIYLPTCYQIQLFVCTTEQDLSTTGGHHSPGPLMHALLATSTGKSNRAFRRHSKQRALAVAAKTMPDALEALHTHWCISPAPHPTPSMHKSSFASSPNSHHATDSHRHASLTLDSVMSPIPTISATKSLNS